MWARGADRAGRTLGACRALRTRRALRALRTGEALGACRALGTRRTGEALNANGTRGAGGTRGADSAGRARGTGRTLRAGRTGRSVRARGAGRTLRTGGAHEANRVAHPLTVLVDDLPVPGNRHGGGVDVAAHVAGEEGVRHALHRSARGHLGVGADGDAEEALGAVDGVFEGGVLTEGDGEIAVLERDGVRLGPQGVGVAGAGVDGELDLVRRVHGGAHVVEQPALVHQGLGDGCERSARPHQRPRSQHECKYQRLRAPTHENLLGSKRLESFTRIRGREALQEGPRARAGRVSHGFRGRLSESNGLDGRQWPRP